MPRMILYPRRGARRADWSHHDQQFRGFRFSRTSSTLQMSNSNGTYNDLLWDTVDFDVSSPFLDPNHAWRDATYTGNALCPTVNRVNRLVFTCHARFGWVSDTTFSGHGNWYSGVTLFVGDTIANGPGDGTNVASDYKQWVYSGLAYPAVHTATVNVDLDALYPTRDTTDTVNVSAQFFYAAPSTITGGTGKLELLDSGIPSFLSGWVLD